MILSVSVYGFTLWDGMRFDDTAGAVWVRGCVGGTVTSSGGEEELQLLTDKNIGIIKNTANNFLWLYYWNNLIKKRLISLINCFWQLLFCYPCSRCQRVWAMSCIFSAIGTKLGSETMRCIFLCHTRISRAQNFSPGRHCLIPHQLHSNHGTRAYKLHQITVVEEEATLCLVFLSVFVVKNTQSHFKVTVTISMLVVQVSESPSKPALTYKSIIDSGKTHLKKDFDWCSM